MLERTKNNEKRKNIEKKEMGVGERSLKKKRKAKRFVLLITKKWHFSDRK